MTGVNIIKGTFYSILGISNLSLIKFVDRICVVLLVPVVMTMIGPIFQPLATMVSVSGLYLLIFCFENLW